MRIFRLHRSVRAAGDYTGAMAAGGRWNPMGTPMLYSAQHLSLACVEVLVHLDKSELPRDYVWSTTELAADPQLLRCENFHSVTSCQADGLQWVNSAGQLAILVPSAVIPVEFNVLLNPSHAGYREVV